MPHGSEVLEFSSCDAAVSYCFVLYLLLIGDAQIPHPLAQLWGCVLCSGSPAVQLWAWMCAGSPAASSAPLGFGVSSTRHLWSSFCCGLFCSICSGAFVSMEQKHQTKALRAQSTNGLNKGREGGGEQLEEPTAHCC